MCVDESSENNELTCVENKYCNKLITYYYDDMVYNKMTCLPENNAKLGGVLMNDERQRHVKRADNNNNKDDDLKSLSIGDFLGSSLVPNSIDLETVSWPPILIEFYEPDDLTLFYAVFSSVMAVVVSAFLVLLILGCVVYKKFYSKG